MKLLFLFGPAAVGKLTVAREIRTRTGFPVFHNHLVVDALLAVFPFGSPPFVELRERFWLDVMGEAATAGTPGMVFTFAPEATVRPGFPERLVERLAKAGSTVSFVELKAPEAVIEERVANESRRAHGKLADVEWYRQLRDSNAFVSPPIAAELSVDTSLHSPAEAAEIIVRALQLASGDVPR